MTNRQRRGMMQLRNDALQYQAEAQANVTMVARTICSHTGADESYLSLLSDEARDGLDELRRKARGEGR